jgi:hypothetical protein
VDCCCTDFAFSQVLDLQQQLLLLVELSLALQQQLAVHPLGVGVPLALLLLLLPVACSALQQLLPTTAWQGTS